MSEMRAPAEQVGALCLVWARLTFKVFCAIILLFGAFWVPKEKLDFPR